MNRQNKNYMQGKERDTHEYPMVLSLYKLTLQHNRQCEMNDRGPGKHPQDDEQNKKIQTSTEISEFKEDVALQLT